MDVVREMEEWASHHHGDSMLLRGEVACAWISRLRQSAPAPSKEAKELAERMRKSVIVSGVRLADHGFHIRCGTVREWADEVASLPQAGQHECERCRAVASEIGEAHMDGHGGDAVSAVRELVDIVRHKEDSRPVEPGEMHVVMRNLPEYGQGSNGNPLHRAFYDPAVARKWAKEQEKEFRVSVMPAIHSVPIHGATQEKATEGECERCKEEFKLGRLDGVDFVLGRLRLALGHEKGGECGLLPMEKEIRALRADSRPAPLSDQSDELREIVREMQRKGPKIGHVSHALDVDGWADRLSRIADKGECERCKELEKDNGLLKTALDSKKQLLESCEAALAEANSRPVVPAEVTVIVPQGVIPRGAYVSRGRAIETRDALGDSYGVITLAVHGAQVAEAGEVDRALDEANGVASKRRKEVWNYRDRLAAANFRVGELEAEAEIAGMDLDRAKRRIEELENTLKNTERLADKRQRWKVERDEARTALEEALAEVKYLKGELEVAAGAIELAVQDVESLKRQRHNLREKHGTARVEADEALTALEECHDALERKQEEVERLEGSRCPFLDDGLHCGDVDRLNKAEAEVERLERQVEFEEVCAKTAIDGMEKAEADSRRMREGIEKALEPTQMSPGGTLMEMRLALRVLLDKPQEGEHKTNCLHEGRACTAPDYCDYHRPKPAAPCPHYYGEQTCTLLAGHEGPHEFPKGARPDILDRFMAKAANPDSTARDYLCAVLESVRDIDGDVAAEFLVKAMTKLDKRVAALEDGK
jgi:hypothetical protein